MALAPEFSLLSTLSSLLYSRDSRRRRQSCGRIRAFDGPYIVPSAYCLRRSRKDFKRKFFFRKPSHLGTLQLKFHCCFNIVLYKLMMPPPPINDYDITILSVWVLQRVLYSSITHSCRIYYNKIYCRHSARGRALYYHIRQSPRCRKTRQLSIYTYSIWNKDRKMEKIKQLTVSRDFFFFLLKPQEPRYI